MIDQATVPSRLGQLLPAQDAPLGLDTARGLLRGVSDPEAALGVALRFLSYHYQVAVAYAVGAHRLEPLMAAGRIEDWEGLRSARPMTGGMSTLVALMRAGEASAYCPTCPADYRMAKLATGTSDVAAVAIPILVGGEPCWVLWAAGPRGDRQPAGLILDELRAEIERALVRLDPQLRSSVAQGA